MIILGNIFSFIGCFFMIFFGIIKDKKRMLHTQVAQFGMQSLSNLVLGSITGFFSMLAYTWYLDTENPITFKIVNLIGVIMWTFHDFHYINYAAFSFDILTIISTLAGIYILLHEKKHKHVNDTKYEVN